MIVMKRVLAVAAVAIAGCSGKPSISQVGYYQSAARDRVFTARMTEGATVDEAKKYAETRPYTEGQMTSVYLYPSNATIPADGITLATSIDRANQALEGSAMSPWKFAFMHYRNGNTEFVDCQASRNELCR
ncbi:hypothetical protein [Mesorhizobium sp. M0859]|uniref:hypothetical protein n=1 Tax=Mesorhizobium sp. M0859 TaxID=2957014 RepID=UPI003338B573